MLGMSHENLDLEYDKNLINKVLDDINMRYIVLFSYIIRNDLLGDLNDKKLVESYERILVLDDIYKENIINFWPEELIEVSIDLGLFKNIRSLSEFKQKDDDFIIKLGEETVTIEQNIITVPDNTLFMMIMKKFRFLTRRNFNLALTRLKGVRCEKSGIIHPFIFQIGENDYAMSNDLYYLLDQFGNIYQAVKMEVTIEGFYKRFTEINDKITEYISIFDPILISKNCVKKTNKAIEENKDVMKYLKDEKIKLSDKLDWQDIDKSAEIFKNWQSKLLKLLKFRYQMEEIDDDLLNIKNYYSGKKKQNNYLEFIEKVSFNEDDIVNKIQSALLDLRNKLVEINKEVSQLTKKDVKILNLDFERFILTS
jgi:hypothetical protein